MIDDNDRLNTSNRSFCEDLLVKNCASAFSSITSLSQFESDFYHNLRSFLAKGPLFEEAQKILDTNGTLFAAVKTAMTSQIAALIQRNVAGVRLKHLDVLADTDTHNLTLQERNRIANCTEAESIVLLLAKQYLLTVRDYARIEPQMAIAHFVIPSLIAEKLAYISSAEVMNLCDRTYSILQFELTAPVSHYIRTIEAANAQSLFARDAVAFAKITRELYATSSFSFGAV